MTRHDTGAANIPETFKEYTKVHETPRFTDWLRKRAEPKWSNATTHRFTRELGRGDLDDEVFQQYLVQDYAFVETLVGVFGHAVGDAPTMESKSRLVDFLKILTADENDYFERSFKALDVPKTEYVDPDLTPTTQAFEDLLKRAARESSYAETLAVLVPAEWTYLEWATHVKDDSPAQFYLMEWIDLHANEEFRAFVTWLRNELDREGKAASPRRQRRIERLFQRIVSLEVAFFETAYEQRKHD
ncbi:TenA family protein [Haladaptatus pallidirubidus]|uniref:TenA family protein n=1 Tax=Haladaptatus pallidirubidus TaxID=1008152 RepID=A0AAV3UIR2_9EURY|nr:TenA family protein [Haladaptatus pallidirubidus]